MLVGEMFKVLNRAPELPKLFLGPPGVGKTEIIKQWANSINRKLYVIPLAHFEPEDLKGIPYVNTNEGKLEIKKGPLIPDKDEEAVVFFDELTCVSGQKIAIALKAIDEKQIGYFTFPKSYIVAAGNPPKWAGFDLDTRIISRFITLEVEEDRDALTDYFMSKYKDNKAMVKVIGFLNFDKPSVLREGKVGEPFPTPRGWEKIIVAHPDGQFDHNIVNGTIGTGTGSQFLAFLKVFENLDVLKKVLDVKQPIPEYFLPEKGRLSTAFALASALAYEVGKNNKQQIIRAVKFIKYGLIQGGNVPHDLFLFFAKTLQKRGVIWPPEIMPELKEIWHELLRVQALI